MPVGWWLETTVTDAAKVDIKKTLHNSCNVLIMIC